MAELLCGLTAAATASAAAADAAADVVTAAEATAAADVVQHAAHGQPLQPLTTQMTLTASSRKQAPLTAC